ncbi:MAG TPA: hypothetical protein VFI11_04015 [Anaerolineales bacterium]|nr:hypothetical protein [Anaerolineales bacterium]
MAAWVNQHSFLLAAGAVIVLAAFFLLRDGFRPMDAVALAALLIGAGAAYALLRPRPGTQDDAASLRAEIGSGQPVLLEFQSPY